MAETTEDRKARLQAELAQIDKEDQERQINETAGDTSLADVVTHLVSHSLGYPTHADREAHLRALRRHFADGVPETTDTPAKAEA